LSRYKITHLVLLFLTFLGNFEPDPLSNPVWRCMMSCTYKKQTNGFVEFAPTSIGLEDTELIILDV
jgi:hypothetical protein